LGLKLFVNPLRSWDRRAAKQADYMVTNSTHTQAMIKQFYKRDAAVVFPPVEVDRFRPKGKKELRHGFVIAGRQVPYKRFDLAIEACDKLGIPLIVIGDGPDHKRLEKLANKLPGRGTTFLSSVSDNDIVEHFQTALGFIMPNMDDFGIVAVEAMAAGTPVIAYNQGGAQDYVIDGKTGLFFDKQDANSLADILEIAATKNFDYDAIVEHAQQFSVSNFVKSMQKYINDCLAERS
jgi:glycosyltransferase involved in cell wall biosynthesis